MVVLCVLAEISHYLLYKTFVVLVMGFATKLVDKRV